MSTNNISKEGFEHRIAETYGPDVLEGVRETIKPCTCGGPLCNGWKLDVDTAVKVIREREES